jgi:signal transduction histidine kinase
VDDRRVLIFPPTRRDGEVTRGLLERAGLTCCVCHSAAELAREMELGAGVVVLTDVGLVAPGMGAVLAVLARQPPWSDLPIVLLCPSNVQSPVAARVSASLSNVTLLERPTSARTLVSAVQAARRGRLRQYETREQFEALVRAEEALRAREQQLHTADRRKDEFLAMLAHELRNPLAPIRNAGELLTRLQPIDPRLQGAAAIVKRQIGQLARLVDDLLDVSRITQGRIELQRRPVDLATVIAEALESVEPLMREKRHEVVLDVRDAPLCVDGDSARLVQCVGNLLANAAKYTDRGGKIRLEAHRDESLAVLTVTDNGVGIPHELLPQIFELFVQSDRSLDRSQGGLGIGLSVVKRLIEMHGGDVMASSEGPGHGAKFEIRLPRIEDVPAVDAPHDAPATAARRVLVVDDNVDAANSLAEILNLSGHQAEPVFNSHDALERSRVLEPDVVLLDIGLPGMDGYEVARRIRSRGSSTRLVALTGYGQTEDVSRAMSAGFDAHLVKPVDLQLLLDTLGRERNPA